ncbi:MAG: hypothetical protein IJ285_06090 [Clostridia bacterium]|nr:hypothetical protein [Clostridia bacterium]
MFKGGLYRSVKQNKKGTETSLSRSHALIIKSMLTPQGGTSLLKLPLSVNKLYKTLILYNKFRYLSSILAFPPKSM